MDWTQIVVAIAVTLCALVSALITLLLNAYLKRISAAETAQVLLNKDIESTAKELSKKVDDEFTILTKKLEDAVAKWEAKHDHAIERVFIKMDEVKDDLSKFKVDTTRRMGDLDVTILEFGRNYVPRNEYRAERTRAAIAPPEDSSASNKREGG